MQHDRDTESPAAIVEFDDVASARGDGLEQILSGLPVLPTMRALIPSLAEGLRVSAGLHAVEDLPRARDGGTKKVRSELIDLVKRSEALREHILLMHRDALNAVREQRTEHNEFATGTPIPRARRSTARIAAEALLKGPSSLFSRNFHSIFHYYELPKTRSQSTQTI
jgi:hypothetical protein